MCDLACDVITCCVWSCDTEKINAFDKIVFENQQKRETWKEWVSEWVGNRLITVFILRIFGIFETASSTKLKFNCSRNFGPVRTKNICNNTFLEINNGKQRVYVSVIIWSTCNCRILPFLHQMFNVSALLQGDELLTRFVTEVVLFSVVAFKTLTIYKIAGLQIVCS